MSRMGEGFPCPPQGFTRWKQSQGTHLQAQKLTYIPRCLAGQLWVLSMGRAGEMAEGIFWVSVEEQITGQSAIVMVTKKCGKTTLVNSYPLSRVLRELC